MKILVCDNDASSRSVIRRLLMLANASEVVECATGAHAIEALTHDEFDALMIDTQLPVLDGFETLGVIRATPHLKHLPVVIITTDRTSGSVQRAVELSVADYVLKPVRMHRLQTSLKAVAARGSGDARTVGTPARAVTIDQRTRVLVVDGDAEFREFLTSLLAPHCTVTTATSGASALTEAWTSGPSLAFIGGDLGPVGPPALVRHLSRLGTRTFVKLATADEIDSDRSSQLYSDVIVRALVPEVMLGDLKRFLSTDPDDAGLSA